MTAANDPTRLAELLALFPEAQRDGRLDLEALLDLLVAFPDVGPAFGLHWPGKAAAFSRAQLDPADFVDPGGEPAKHPLQRSCVIEADNLEAMHWLAAEHAGRFSLVCIDPPYNTGGRFTYDDDFRTLARTRRLSSADASDRATHRAQSQRDHSRWLTMLAPRLLAVVPLLRSDGVVAVHIDEHEEHHLRVLLDEVVGPANYLGSIVWDKANPKGDAKTVAYQHETIVLYAKDRGAWQRDHSLSRDKPNAPRMLAKAAEFYRRGPSNGLPAPVVRSLRRHGIDPCAVAAVLPRSASRSPSEDFAAWVRAEPGLSAGEAAYDQLDADGEVFRLVHMGWPNKRPAPPAYFAPLIHPHTGQPCPLPARGWRYPPETMAELLAAGAIVFGRDHTVQPQRKYRLRECMTESLPSIVRYGGSDERLFGELKLPFFSHPKPHGFIAELVHILAPACDAWILDPFAGSGTTGHAVWEANKRDGGKRRFVLIQRHERSAGESHCVAEVCRSRLAAVAYRYPEQDTGVIELSRPTKAENNNVTSCDRTQGSSSPGGALSNGAKSTTDER